MRKKSLWIVLCVGMLVLALALSGCGSKKAAEEPKKPTETFSKEKPTSMVVGSASIGGTYYLYAQGVANLAAEALGITVSVEVTDGPNDNLIGVQDKQFLLGLTTMGPAYEAWEGLENWTRGIKHQDVRSLFPMYNTYFHWIADTGSGITSLKDMAGKRVGMGPLNGTIGTYGPRFFQLLGIDAKISNGGIQDLVETQGNGLLDANGFAAGLPVTAFKTYEVNRGPANVVFIGINGEDRDKIIAQWPYFAPAVIPASTYDALSADLETIGVWNVAIASKYLDDEYAYKIVKAVLENNEKMKAAHPSAKETLIDNFEHMDIIPLHPGAIKYYKEKGLTIPAHLIPPEYTE